ncbi:MULTISPECIES: succinate dehydrogenase, hydrophobic membrane anchor protein [Methylobacteriaceae]|uniref:Succinate dehydrogenase hydrophobic membrane anchor subunit n=1 Tax=Methylorubrum populi TaxID=223967 RepID=A0A160PHZ5_9HYPH|nr:MULTISPECIES: succinate dehydrogenase, hydrophobic membrane anchor protein [Methylobacteriaceae]MBB2964387.1 succinate dehydrogenase / fumarate reductase membrane anchor subunit [Methylobacterium sp. R2-1]BAU92524.1 succinate dehydrogenase, hydrophobic membrane anchor protein [Methylorubrum populi]HJE22092.1 succinate dehydrogenase, hydrophobic membrane anchor protein [Methylorubrum populi]
MSQVDNRQNTALSMRTPRARVKGLGASGHGAGHFWLQRLTGASNALLMLAFVVIIALMAGRTYPQAVALVSHPLVAIILILAVVSVTIHMRLGMQTVIEDYVHSHGLKFAALIANTFYAVAVAAACLYAIIRVSLGGLA